MRLQQLMESILQFENQPILVQIISTTEDFIALFCWLWWIMITKFCMLMQVRKAESVMEGYSRTVVLILVFHKN